MSCIGNAQPVRAPDLPITLFLLVFQTDLSPITVLLVFAVDAVQLELSGCFSELHIDPAMRMAFSKIVTDGRLVNEMEMVPSIVLPLMRVTIEIGLWHAFVRQEVSTETTHHACP